MYYTFSEKLIRVIQILAIMGITVNVVKLLTARSNGADSPEGFCVFQANTVQLLKYEACRKLF